MSERTKNQHYVPQFYLKFFTNNCNELERFNIHTNKTMSPRGTKPECSKDFFYGLRTGKYDDVSQRLEKWFTAQENMISRNLSQTITNIESDNSISYTSKALVARLLTMILIRGPLFRRMINLSFTEGISKTKELLDTLPKESYKKFLRNRYSKYFNESDFNELLNKDSDNYFPNNLLHLQMLDTLEEFTNIFSTQQWMIFKNDTAVPFITSDNPVSPERVEERSSRGIGIPAYKYHFALTPKLHVVTNPNIDDYMKKTHRRTLNSEIEVLKLNSYIADVAIKKIYSSQRNSFSEIMMIIDISRRTV